MNKYTCKCGQEFYRNPNKLTACPTCLQVVIDIDGKTAKAFPEREHSQ